MRNYIILNGQNSNGINGLLIQSLPPITKPLMRTQVEEIDGRDGDIVTKLGFSAYNKEFTVGLYGDYNVDEVIGYFNSEGVVTFSNEPDKYYKYQILEQIDFERLIRFKTATVKMHCQPFKYSTTEVPAVFENVENLVSIPDFTQTTNGITVNVENGVISVEGTGSAAAEFYIPITSLTLSEGDYVLRALGVGTSPEACSVRVIYNSPSAANSFGGTYTTLQNNTTVTITATITQDKTYNYIYLYITPNMSLDFTLDLRVTVTEGLVSGDGDIINLQETSLASFNKFDLKGNTEQQTYSGKNYIKPYQTSGSIERAGVTFTMNEDGSILINGTATGNIYAEFVFIFGNTSTRTDPVLPLDENATYTFSAQIKSGTYSGRSILYIQYNAPNAETSIAMGGSKTITGANGLYRSWVRAFSGDTFDNLTLCPQLELGTTKTDFEPFVGGAPSPNPDYPQNVEKVTGEQKLMISAKNLVKPYQRSGSITKNGVTLTMNSDGTIVLNGTSTGNSWLEFCGGFKTNPTVRTTPVTRLDTTSTYTLSYKVISGTKIGTNPYIYVQYGYPSDESAVRINSDNPVTTAFSGKDGIYRLWIRTFSNTVYNNLVLGVQIEKGSATDFEPYQDQTYTVNLGSLELCKIGDYQDYIYLDGDEWYMHKEIGKVVLDGSETYARTAFNNISGYHYYGTAVIDQLIKSKETTALSDNFFVARNLKSYNDYLRPNFTLPSGVSMSPCFSTASTLDSDTNYQALRFAMPDTLITDVNDFKTWLSTHNTTVYYALATPTDTKITDTTLVGQLEAIGSQAYSYDGQTNLTSSSSNCPIILSVEAIKANKATITNSGNTTAKPILTIYGTGDIGVYLNGSQVFKVALGDEGYITIDTNLMEAYKDTPNNLKNRLVDGDYTNFVLVQGESLVTFSGSVDRCVIENYSRWL